MVLLGDRPILWHIMNIYASQGFKDFVIAAGYKSEIIFDWTKGLSTDWNVSVLDTGRESGTGYRIKKCVETFPEDRYFITYGDGLGNVRLDKLIETHNKLDKLVTVTAVRPPARFGVLEIEENLVTHFGEKSQSSAGWINGGFFLAENGFSDFIEDNPLLSFEASTLPYLARSKELGAHLHFGFWKPMDTLREKRELEEMMQTEKWPWLT